MMPFKKRLLSETRRGGGVQREHKNILCEDKLNPKDGRYGGPDKQQNKGTHRAGRLYVTALCACACKSVPVAYYTNVTSIKNSDLLLGMEHGRLSPVTEEVTFNLNFCLHGRRRRSRLHTR